MSERYRGDNVFGRGAVLPGEGYSPGVLMEGAAKENRCPRTYARGKQATTRESAEVVAKSGLSSSTAKRELCDAGFVEFPEARGHHPVVLSLGCLSERQVEPGGAAQT